MRLVLKVRRVALVIKVFKDLRATKVFKVRLALMAKAPEEHRVL